MPATRLTSSWRRTCYRLALLWVLAAWNLDAQTSWTQLSPTGGPPPARETAAAALDSTNNRMIVFGGNTGGGPPGSYAYPSTPLNDVWVLSNADGTGGASQWTALSPSGGPPQARSGATALYDAANNRLIVFGGNPSEGNCVNTLNDVWVLTNANGMGGSPAWTQLTPTGSAPRRWTHSAVYDAANNRMIVFGGTNHTCSGIVNNEVWLLTNANGLGGAPVWSQLDTSGTLPAARTFSISAYDATNNRLVLMGGSTSSGLTNDVWVLTKANGLGGSAAWIELAPAGALPSPRSVHAAALDSAFNRLLVFGGFELASSTNDVWVLSNASAVGGIPAWDQAFPSGGPPAPRYRSSAVYNSVSRRLIVSGGVENCGTGCTPFADVWVLADAPTAGLVKFATQSTSAPETAGSALINVKRLGGSAGTVAVDYSLTGGTATAGDDYQFAAGTLTFAAGETSKVISVGIVSDATPEANETVEITLTNPTGGAVLGNPTTAVLSILDPSQPAPASWLIAPRANFQRADHSATLLPNGKVLVAGGTRDGILHLASAELYDPATGTWSATGSMANIRRSHGAVLLPTGKVLVVGGYGPGGIETASAELYDPGTGTWTATGSLINARFHPLVVLLKTGEVLVTSGSVAGTSGLASAELYNPASGQWRAAPSMIQGRYATTATLLPSGKVLVAGGAETCSAGACQALTSAELYNPATNQWEPTGSLSGGKRAQHCATLLPSGKVLVAGGQSDTQALLSTAELYDPAFGTWAATGSLTTGRNGVKSVLLADGRVLLDGPGASFSDIYDPSTSAWTPGASPAITRVFGTMTLLPQGQVLAVGGVGPSAASSAGLYAPAAAGWQATATLATGRSSHTSTLLASGKVLLTGGADGTGVAMASAELFDPTGNGGAGSTSAAPSLNTARRSHTATLLSDSGGRVLVAGGLAGSPLNNAEWFDPAANGGAGSWSFTGALSTSRYAHTATLLPAGGVLVTGGIGASGTLNSAEIFNPAGNGGSGSWSSTASMISPRANHTATRLPSGSVLVTGGRNGVALSASELYSAGLWTTGASMTIPRESHSATLLPSGLVLIAGGRDDSGRVLSSAELYDPASGRFTSTGSMTVGRYGHVATLLIDGRVLVSCGYAGGTIVGGEIYDPSLGTWSAAGSGVPQRQAHTATLLPDGRVLVAGGSDGTSALTSAELFGSVVESRRPVIASASGEIAYGVTLTITGSGFNGDSEATHGTAQSSAVNFPILLLRALANEQNAWLIPGNRTILTEIPVSTLPPALEEGWYMLSVIAAAVPSRSKLIRVACSVDITNVTGPGAPVSLGTSATFTVAAQGARGYQWQRCTSETCAQESQWTSIAGATEATYRTPPVTSADAGARFRVVVTGNCATETSAALTLSVSDNTPPDAAVVAPSGGEYWVLSSADKPPNTRVVTWSMSDNVRVCQAAVSLLYSTNGGASYSVAAGSNNVVFVRMTSGGSGYTSAPTVTFTGGGGSGAAGTAVLSGGAVVGVTITNGGTGYTSAPDVSFSGGGGTGAAAAATVGLPATFGPGGACAYPGEATTSLTYTVPVTPPSGQSGSLYKIRLVVLDQASNSKTVESEAFYIVQSNPDSVKTLILTNIPRMVSEQSITPAEVTLLNQKLQELANHPRVQGLVVNLDIPAIRALYDLWDLDSGNASKVNAVLFGAGGIHEYLRTNVLSAYGGVEYLVVVGDDRIIPMARATDHTVLFLESSYPAGGDLSPTASTVGQALNDDRYLTDDPLASLDPVAASALDGNVFLPDLRIGRLVETPQEIVKTIATYISQDGILDLSLLHPTTGHKVLVTGYDFLTNAASEMSILWKGKLGDTSPDPEATVDATLVGGGWGGSASVRKTALRDKLSGNGGPRYGVMAIAGHATHYEEGVPGASPQDIDGLATADIYGPDACASPTLGALDLSGAVVYAAGCHGGLPVPGSCGTGLTLDLAQTMLARGVVAYIANSGYGWALRRGIGYSARLLQIFTEEMTLGDTNVVGDLVNRSKARYLQESPRFDSYDEKSIMQWTLFGLPMYAVRTVAAGSARVPAAQSVTTDVEQLGAVRVKRELTRPSTLVRSDALSANALPQHLTQLTLSFDFTGADVYRKRDSSGAVLPAGPGCPDPNGCFYSLNGLYDRGTGSADLPIQPYLIYDSKLSGSSQHGVLWKGGTYDQESNWKPVFAELISNGGDGSNHGVAPRVIRPKPRPPRIFLGQEPSGCRPGDNELNSLTFPVGEAVKEDLTYSITRRYRNTDLEVFYYNNTSTTNRVDSVVVASAGSGYTSAPAVTFSGGGGSGAAGTAVVASGAIVSVTITSGGSGYTSAPSVSFTGGGGSGASGTATLAGPINNCDREGPELLPGPNSGRYESVSGATISWAVPVKDTLAGIWRVVVVYNLNTVNGQGQGAWLPVELTDDGTRLTPDDGTRMYRGSVTLGGGALVTYVIQAVDNRGNITWLDYVSAQTPSSGVPLGVPASVERLVGTTIQAPGSVLATASTATTVGLSWAPSAGAVTYDVYRSASGTSYAFLGSSGTTSYSDTTAQADTAYLYAVKAVDAVGAESAMSNPDLATTVVFTDPTLTAGTTPVKRLHLMELRTAVSAVRTLAGLGAFSFTDPTITAGSTLVKAAHITDLRTALNDARAALLLSSVSYADPTLTPGSTSPKTAHMDDLRDGVR